MKTSEKFEQETI